MATAFRDTSEHEDGNKKFLLFKGWRNILPPSTRSRRCLTMSSCHSLSVGSRIRSAGACSHIVVNRVDMGNGMASFLTHIDISWLLLIQHHPSTQVRATDTLLTGFPPLQKGDCVEDTRRLLRIGVGVLLKAVFSGLLVQTFLSQACKLLMV